MPCGMEHSWLLTSATIFFGWWRSNDIGIMAWHAWVLFGRTLDSFMIAVAPVIGCTSHLPLVRKKNMDTLFNGHQCIAAKWQSCENCSTWAQIGSSCTHKGWLVVLPQCHYSHNAPGTTSIKFASVDTRKLFLPTIATGQWIQIWQHVAWYGSNALKFGCIPGRFPIAQWRTMVAPQNLQFILAQSIWAIWTIN